MSRELRLEALGHFLCDRRARIRPAHAGLPPTARRRVRGLRREEVAMLAGVGVSWYTALENGTASGVSVHTLLAIADVLRLSASERPYVTALVSDPGEIENEEPGPLLIETMNALTVPAYIITASWNVPDCNAAFRRLWNIGDEELPFNAIERLFMHPLARTMHADRFIPNITPVVSVLRSGIGRRPAAKSLHLLGERLQADEAIRRIWDDYGITSPWTPAIFTIESAVGTFSYTDSLCNYPISLVVNGSTRRRRVTATDID